MIYNIQALRAVAALFVVSAHFVDFNRPLLERPLGFGIYGVDLFFVISGLVMVHTTSAKPVAPLRFMANRVMRIVPLYWAATLTIFFVALFAPTLLHDTRADWSQLLKSLFFIPFEKSNGVLQPILFLGWTLNYEMYFYALFAVGLLVPSVPKRVLTVAAVFVALVALGAVLRPLDIVARFYTDPIVLEFAYGMVIGVIAGRLSNTRAVALLSKLAVAGGLIWLVAFPIAVANPPWQAATIGLPAAAVVLGAVRLEASGARVSSPWLLLLGSASYALYLSHAFVIIAVGKTLGAFGLAGDVFLVAVVILGTATAIVVAIALYLGFERPVGRLLHGRMVTSRTNRA